MHRFPPPAAEKAGAPRVLLAAMDSRDRGLGQATFRDFVEFMGGEPRSAAYLRPSGERGVSPRRAGSVEQVGHRYIVHGILMTRVRAVQGGTKPAKTEVARASGCRSAVALKTVDNSGWTSPRSSPAERHHFNEGVTAPSPYAFQASTAWHRDCLVLPDRRLATSAPPSKDFTRRFSLALSMLNGRFFLPLRPLLSRP